MAHHHATVVVERVADGASVVRWGADLLPHDAAARIAPMMDAGVAAMRQALDRVQD
jgi:hypothetical protein